MSSDFAPLCPATAKRYILIEISSFTSQLLDVNIINLLDS